MFAKVFFLHLAETCLLDFHSTVFCQSQSNIYKICDFLGVKFELYSQMNVHFAEVRLGLTENRSPSPYNRRHIFSDDEKRLSQTQCLPRFLLAAPEKDSVTHHQLVNHGKYDELVGVLCPGDGDAYVYLLSGGLRFVVKRSKPPAAGHIREACVATQMS